MLMKRKFAWNPNTQLLMKKRKLAQNPDHNQLASTPPIIWLGVQLDGHRSKSKILEGLHLF
jgi:hypothetical protein